MKLLANKNRMIQISSQGGWTPAAPEMFNFIETISEKVKIDGAGLLLDQIQWSVLGLCTFPEHTHVKGSSLTPVIATSKNIMCDNMKVLREDDEGICSGTFTNNNSGAAVTCSCKLKIYDAGQTKVKGE